MGQVDSAGSEVYKGYGDALPLQSGQLVEVHSAELESIDEVGWFRAAEAKGEVVLVEQSDLLLQEEGGGGVYNRSDAVNIRQSELSLQRGGRYRPNSGANGSLLQGRRTCIVETKTATRTILVVEKKRRRKV